MSETTFRDQVAKELLNNLKGNAADPDKYDAESWKRERKVKPLSIDDIEEDASKDDSPKPRAPKNNLKNLADEEDEEGPARLRSYFARRKASGSCEEVKDWSEADHPRGQPENAGQFGPGGGGSSSASDDKRDSATAGKPSNRLPSGKKATKPPCCLYDPDPIKSVNEKTGLVDKARVGVPAMEVPPPPKTGIGRLPNLDKKQRKVETRFAEAYLADPDGMAKKYSKALRKGKVGVAKNVYATDDVKMLNRDWNPGKAKAGEELPNVSKKAMAKYNTAVHQTANAIAKRAFLGKLKEMSNLPDGDPKKSVLVTNGGCAAGKGSTLSHAAEPDSPYNNLVPAADRVGAVWDAAGEQNATENEWIYQECKKHGITATFAYVWAEPEDTWDAKDRGVIRRAVKKGRMVDAKLFADSYALGAKNMNAFYEKHKDEANFIFIDNRKKGDPKVIEDFPKETLKWDTDKIYKMAVDNLKGQKGLSKELVEGGLNGGSIWG